MIVQLWRTFLLTPFKLITVFLHEASHAIACKLTCGEVIKFSFFLHVCKTVNRYWSIELITNASCYDFSCYSIYFDILIRFIYTLLKLILWILLYADLKIFCSRCYVCMAKLKFLFLFLACDTSWSIFMFCTSKLLPFNMFDNSIWKYFVNVNITCKTKILWSSSSLPERN